MQYFSGSYESPPLGGADLFSSLQLITSAVSQTSAISYPAQSRGSHSPVARSNPQPGRWSSSKYLRHIGSSTDSIFIITCLPHLDLWNRVTSLTHLDLLSLVFPPSHTSTCKQVGCKEKLSRTISTKPECGLTVTLLCRSHSPSTHRRSSVIISSTFVKFSLDISLKFM